MVSKRNVSGSAFDSGNKSLFPFCFNWGPILTVEGPSDEFVTTSSRVSLFFRFIEHFHINEFLYTFQMNIQVKILKKKTIVRNGSFEKLAIGLRNRNSIVSSYIIWLGRSACWGWSRSNRLSCLCFLICRIFDLFLTIYGTLLPI